jgi:hypothetical protein
MRDRGFLAHEKRRTAASGRKEDDNAEEMKEHVRMHRWQSKKKGHKGELG